MLTNRKIFNIYTWFWAELRTRVPNCTSWFMEWRHSAESCWKPKTETDRYQQNVCLLQILFRLLGLWSLHGYEVASYQKSRIHICNAGRSQSFRVSHLIFISQKLGSTDRLHHPLSKKKSAAFDYVRHLFIKCTIKDVYIYILISLSPSVTEQEQHLCLYLPAPSVWEIIENWIISIQLYYIQWL